jgi:hypothetical protein
MSAKEKKRGLSQRLLPSTLKIVLFSVLASCCVVPVSLIIQWIVYDDWLHRTGPLRLVGTSIATVITFGFVLRWQRAVRARQREMLLRFEKISRMNDRIRNALQAIACITYLSEPQATEAVRQSVQVIDEVLREVLEDATHGPASAEGKLTSAADAGRRSA